MSKYVSDIAVGWQIYVHHSLSPDFYRSTLLTKRICCVIRSNLFSKGIMCKQVFSWKNSFYDVGVQLNFCQTKKPNIYAVEVLFN